MQPSPVLRLAPSAALLAAMRPSGVVEVSDPNTLVTPRLVIRPLTWSDRAEFLRVIGLSREHLRETFPLHKEGESDAGLFERLLHLSQRGLETRLAWRCASFDRAGRMVGMFNLNDIARGLEGRAEANWWTSADQLRRGLATEGLRAVLSHAFADLPRGLGLQRVTALISPVNHISRAVAGKTGFRLGAGPGASALLTLAGQRVPHDVFEVFAPLTAARSTRRSPRLRAGLEQILVTEAALAAAA